MLPFQHDHDRTRSLDAHTWRPASLLLATHGEVAIRAYRHWALSAFWTASCPLFVKTASQMKQASIAKASTSEKEKEQWLEQSSFLWGLKKLQEVAQNISH